MYSWPSMRAEGAISPDARTCVYICIVVQGRVYSRYNEERRRRRNVCVAYVSWFSYEVDRRKRDRGKGGGTRGREYRRYKAFSIPMTKCLPRGVYLCVLAAYSGPRRRRPPRARARACSRGC